MLLNLLEYYWAEDLDDALLLLARSDIKTVPLAGGTYLLGSENEEIQAVVDLRDLELAYIDEDTRDTQGRTLLRIGAMTTLSALADSTLLREAATGILAHAAKASSSSLLIRNSATLGGTLATGAASQADLLTVLAVLDAEVVLRSGSKTQVDLSGGSLERPGLALAGVTFKGKQERRVPFISFGTQRRPNELIIEVTMPLPDPDYGGSFMRIGRTAGDVALLNAAAVVAVKDNRYQYVRLALGGVNMEPVRLSTVERHLVGQPVNQAGGNALDVQRLASTLQTGMASFQPPSDFRASSGYRRVVAMNLAFRALEEATNVSRWRNMVSEGGQ
ncbi:MAG TPA: FAD binding domain-containing protein [Ktedonobacteraceae bacterium]|nr:FAD binding domain-containing protein [Ktedonobacteraceae bacterium]